MTVAQKLRVTFLCLLVSGSAYGVTNTAGTITQWDGSDLFVLKNPSGTQTNILSISGNEVGVELFKSAYGSGYIHGTAQAFTAAGGYQIITGYLAVVSANMGTLTSSNLTVISDGCYMLTCSYSIRTSAAANDITIHAFTNGVEVVSAGTGIYLPNASQNRACNIGAIMCLYSNDYVDLRLDTDKNCTMTFEHADATLIKIGP
jgi:hypothetical protein